MAVTDEVETPKLLDEMSSKNATAASRESKPGLLARLWRLLVRLVLFLVVAGGLGLIGYQLWILTTRLEQVSAENSGLRDQLVASDARLAALEDSLARVPTAPALAAEVSSTLDVEFGGRLEQLNSDLTDLRNQFSGTIAGEDARWRLLEAEYLHRLANQHLGITADIPTTVALLENVDQLLADSGDSRVSSARAALTVEMEQLRSLVDYDPDALFSDIEALRQQVGDLEATPASQQNAYLARLDDTAVATTTANQAIDGSGEAATGTLLDTAREFLSSVFIWRDWQDISEITEPPGALFFAAQNIDLLLHQAQLALLAHHPSSFRDSLGRARELLAANQVGLGEATLPIIAELDQLLASQPVPDLPDLSRSMDLVEQLTPNPLAGTRDAVQ